jgi:hypothetical protein
VAGSTLTYTLIGEDKSASKAMKGVGDAADKSAKKAKSSWSDAGKALSALAIVKFGADSVKAFSEAEASTAKLQQAFEKFPKLGDSSAASVDKISAALQKKTKFDGDATNAAAALLGQFDLTGKQIEGLLPLLQDYASATGQDIQGAATSLGKAFNGQTRALKAVGINYTSTGDKAKDFANITDLLSQKVGGFAENEGKTAAGQLEILKNQFGDVQEAIGGALVPALTEITKVALPVAQVLGDLVGWFGELPGPVKLGAGAVALLFAAMKSEKIMGFVSSLKTATTTTAGFKSALAGIGKGAAIGAGIAIFTQMLEDGFQAQKTFKAGVDALVDSYGDLGPKIDEATRKIAFQNIAAASNGAVLKWAHDNGIAADKLVDAYLGLPGGDEVKGKLLAWSEGMGGGNGLGRLLTGITPVNASLGKTKEEITGLFGQFDASKSQWKEQDDAIHGATGSIAALGEAHREAAAAMRGTGAAVDTTAESARNANEHWSDLVKTLEHGQRLKVNIGEHNQLAGLKYGLEGVKAAADYAAGSVELFGLAMDRLAGRNVPVEEAIQGWHDALNNLKGALSGDDTPDISTVINSPEIQKATGELINTTSEFGSTVQNALGEARKGYDTVTTSAYTTALATGDVSGATDKARAAADHARAAFIAQNAGMEGGTKAAGELATRLGIVEGTKITPKTLAIGADFSDAKLAVEQVGTMKVGNKTFYVDGKTGEAFASLKELEDHRLPTAHLPVVADTATAHSDLSYLFNSWNGKPIHFSVGVQQAHASGGPISGPGTGTSDSVPIMASAGEHMVTASEVQAAGGHGAMFRLRRAMRNGLLHFAGGGGVPGFNFKGTSAPSYGERQGNVIGAFGDLKDWLKELGQTAKDTAAKARDAAHALRVAENTRTSEIAAVKKSNAERLASAQKNLDEAKTTAQKTAAQAKLTKVEKDNAAALDKVTTAQNRKVKAAKAEADSTAATAKAADRKNDAEHRVYEQTARTRTLLSAASKVYDQYNAKLDQQKDKLANLKSDKSALAGAVAGNISGIGGGILGNSETRTNPASILKGMQYNLKGQTAYTKNLAALKAKGLSPELLSQIAQGGEEGQRVAASLAGASKGEIAQINRTQAAIDKNAKVGGALVGGAVYDKQIAAQQKQIDATTKTAQAALDAIGAFSDALTKGFKLQIDSQGIARLNAKGVADLKRRGVNI